MKDASIRICGVSKHFGVNPVLTDVSATMRGRRIYGIVGRNGSGKTVLLKLICGFMAADKGGIWINKKKIPKSANLPMGIGSIIEAPGFLPHLSGYRNLALLASIQGKIGKAEIRAAMEAVKLNPKSRMRVGKYSLGMRQRLGVAQAIMENPSILVLDEPMNGLDQEGVELVRALLQKLRDKGALILLATHIREDVELLCDEVYRIRDGRMTLEEAST